MSKKIILIAIAALLTSNLFGQNWNLNPDNTIYYNNGNVGIGTTSPSYTLDIDKGAGNTANARIKGQSPSITYTIHRETGTGAAINAMNLSFFNGTTTTNLINVGMLANNNIGSIPTLDYFFIGNSYSDNAFRIYPNKDAHFDGNVGIGTTSPTGDLDIASVNTPQVYIQSLATSSQDAILNIRGSRTSSTTGDIAQIKFGSNDVTGGDLASITARKHTASTNEGDLLFWTTTTNGDTPTEKMRITKDGYVGIGTTNPVYGKLQINKNTLGDNSLLSFSALDGTYNPRVYLKHNTSETRQYLEFTSSYSTGVGRADFIFSYGNVGIGTTAPPYKLSVEGTIGAREVIVTSEEWPDFVFEPTYKLMPLKELDTYIQENKHLPEIPTTAEVKENGISVGEMNAKLLQKIEELTLYVIELKKEVEILKEQNNN